MIKKIVGILCRLYNLKMIKIIIKRLFYHLVKTLSIKHKIVAIAHIAFRNFLIKSNNQEKIHKNTCIYIINYIIKK